MIQAIDARVVGGMIAHSGVHGTWLNETGKRNI